MNKNYISIIRKSFNTPKEGKPGDTRKIIFPTSDYKSESVFTEECLENELKCELELHKKKKKKLKKSPQKKMKQCEGANALDETLEWKRDDEDIFFSPSTSEFDLRKNYNRTSNEKFEVEEFLLGSHEDISNSEDSSDEFALDEFSYSRDHISNESLTEAHSGIEEIFNTPPRKEVRIRSKKIMKKIKNIQVTTDTFDNLKLKTEKRKKNLETSNRSNNDSTPLELSNENLKQTNKTSNDDLNGICFQECRNNKDAEISEKEVSNMDCESITPTANDFNGENTLPVNINMQYFDLDNVKIVVLKDQKSIPIYGYFLIKVLRGQVEILGSIINKSNEMIKIYSPRGYSLLVLKNVTMNESECHLNELYQFPQHSKTIGSTIIERNSAVFLCFKLEDERLKFMQQYISHQIFPKINFENAPKVTFEPKDNMNVLCEDNSWKDIVNIVQSTTKLFIAGGKGVGKSTVLRYMINKLLGKFENIRVIDLDPGQSEFYMPGTVSVFTISEPIIGPNYTHIRKPERSYLCDINVADPIAYIRQVTSLVEYVSNVNKIPTLINYMGYSKGLGIKIISTVITLLRPTNVVQIESKSKHKNFVCDLNVANIRKNCDYFGGSPSGLTYKLHKLGSLADTNVGWKLEPRQARELAILAYLGEGMININSLTDHNLPMYKLKLSFVKIRDLKNKEITPAAINANLVALCNLDELSENFICLGFGVVRGIDLENDYLVLITQVNPELLDDISYLVLSSVSLPPSIYMTTQSIRGLIPYVMEGELSSLAQLTKRSYLPAVHTFSK